MPLWDKGYSKKKNIKEQYLQLINMIFFFFIFGFILKIFSIFKITSVNGDPVNYFILERKQITMK
jgi:hypothetical protein